MDTDTTTRDTTAPEATDAEAALKEQYPAVTQFKGRTIRYAPLTGGQAIALQTLERDGDDKLTNSSMAVILAVLEGCIGPEQWKRISLDLARKRLEAADPIQLFMKIMDKTKRDADRASKA